MNDPLLLNATGEVICPTCTGKTKKKFGYELSSKQHLIAGIMCLTVCLAPCFWVPYCINDWKDIKYTCNICGGRLH
uniref:CSON012539 protein n=1 Tax=Culicoides sonorensis TaxID=179676 RepID=A0A336K0I1_CULSO